MRNPLLQKANPERMFRSGSWDIVARVSNLSYRNGHDAADRDYYQGFRLFRTVEKS
jgi:formylglycine-generating enzyme required for sulfatase activity